MVKSIQDKIDKPCLTCRKWVQNTQKKEQTVGNEQERIRLTRKWYDKLASYKQTAKKKTDDKLNAKSSKTNERVFRKTRSVRICGECGSIETANWKRHWDNKHSQAVRLPYELEKGCYPKKFCWESYKTNTTCVRGV